MLRVSNGGFRTRSDAHSGRVAILIGIAVSVFLVATGSPSPLAGATSLLPPTAEALRVRERAPPTPAWTSFCGQLPDECTVDHAEPAIIRFSPAIWSTIIEVNERVNGTILSVTDRDHWGVIDRWNYPDDGLGDCEDIQLLKRRLLVEARLPRRAMRMTVVADEEGQGHAVLMVRTDRGDFILDNKRNEVLPWQETGYRYVKREGSDSTEWVWVGEQVAPMVTAKK
jgi:predicted transglutaminase-like cysteine proteinase